MGDPAVLRAQLRQEPPTWLPDASRLDDGRWLTTVHGAGLSQTVAMRIGAPWSSTTTLWRTVTWDPLRTPDPAEHSRRPLPSFDGELGLFVSGAVASLVLEGRYHPPGGHLGAVLDGLALHRVAKATLDRLMMDIAGVLADHGHGSPSPGSDTTLPDDLRVRRSSSR